MIDVDKAMQHAAMEHNGKDGKLTTFIDGYALAIGVGK
jgi:hypothetical protein